MLVQFSTHDKKSAWLPVGGFWLWFPHCILFHSDYLFLWRIILCTQVCVIYLQLHH